MGGDEVNSEPLEAWEFPAGVDLDKIAGVAEGRLTPADLRGVLVSSRGDVLTLQVFDGQTPDDPEFRLWVRGRGAYEILRREAWPDGRELVVLRAWGGRG
jgi:hypothetical protein